jgi:hypothetical protein
MADEEFWVVLLSFDGNHYPQGPVRVRSNGVWRAPKIFIGGPNDSGPEWEILAVAADTSKARKWFVDYLAKGKKTGSFPGKRELPRDTVTIGSVAVIRM